MKTKGIALGMLVLLLAFGGFYIYQTIEGSKKRNDKKQLPAPVQMTEPQFTHEGNLWLFRTGQNPDTLKQLEIEIADDEYSITTGMMYRSFMEENRGMLFLFPNSTDRSFWMKNCKVSLDIIFITSDKRILSIAKNTKPFSEASIPSNGAAQYVLEVNAGLSDKLGLKEGDLVNWQIFQP